MANVYVTAGADGAVVSSLHEAAHSILDEHGQNNCLLLNTFCDPHYNRTSYSFGGCLAAVSSVIEAFVGQAIAQTTRSSRQSEQSSGRSQSFTSASNAFGGEHPRLGAVDHISMHPLLTTPLGDVGTAARALGRRLAQSYALPIYYYGAAHHSNRPLAEIRRASSYFKAVQSRSDSGSCDKSQPFGSLELQLPLDEAPSAINPSVGVCTLGAVPPVLNYNIRVHCADGAFVRKVARAVSARGGGLAGVEALALPYSSGRDVWEIGCNLLDQSASPPSKVLQRVTELLLARPDGSEPLQYDPDLLSVGVYEPINTPSSSPSASAARIIKEYTIGMSRATVEATLEQHFEVQA